MSGAADAKSADVPRTSSSASAASVELHLYDLSGGMARSFAPMLGLPLLEAIWHSSVVIRETDGRATEHFFGFGVQQAAAGTTPFGRAMRVLPLGRTELDAETRESLLADLSERYRPHHYNLVSNNCNHFANEFAELVCGAGAPTEVVGQAAALLRTPLGQMVEPWLRQMEGFTGRATATGFNGGSGGGGGGGRG
jgi:hypothetical protein